MKQIGENTDFTVGILRKLFANKVAVERIEEVILFDTQGDPPHYRVANFDIMLPEAGRPHWEVIAWYGGNQTFDNPEDPSECELGTFRTFEEAVAKVWSTIAAEELSSFWENMICDLIEEQQNV
jgi:hypothetical protein